ncbi:hypothetical protein AQJ64_36650 [Streptomyces griseoruber]|uniref:Uncharacterized protein n=1 Tax=Streptomyces griseoruber TaxID=1943 RepID=A0A101SMF7_9ACTN|nr:hypothetical protein AQJ64_36650 [Streptomyces griseoruber]
MMRERERRRGLAPEKDVGRDILQGGFEPCLLALLRLSVGRDPGTDLTSGWFPRALARTGHLVRAAELAYTISDELKQGTELVELVKAAAGAGDLGGAQALAESIPLRQLRDQALVALVPRWARAGERARAVALAERIRYPHNRGWAWALLAKAAADSGDIDETLRFAARADDEVSSCAVDGTEQVLALLVEVAVATGDHDRAAALADRVEDITRSRNPAGWSKPRSLAVVLAREALGGDLDRLDALLQPPPGPAVGAGGTVCGWALGEAGDQDMVLEGDLDETAAGPFSTGSPLGAWDMACVLDAVAETAGQDVALALADRAETLLETGDGRDHDILLRSVTLLLARHGQVERAMSLTDRLDPVLSVARQADIVGELARSGDTGGAVALAHAITDRRARARALIEVVRELARRGDPGRAGALAHAINDRWAQGEALLAVARELARHGDPGRAETLTRSIAHRGTRARALAALVELSEPSRACRLAAQVVVLGGWDPVLPVLERIVPRSVAVVVDQMMS